MVAPDQIFSHLFRGQEWALMGRRFSQSRLLSHVFKLGSVRYAGVENLSRADDIVKAAHDFFHRCDSFPDVRPIQVDIVGLQSLQTGFHCLHHALAVIPRRIRIVAWRGIGIFRRKNDTLTMALYEFAHEFFARAASLEIRSVKEVSARLAVGLINFQRFRLR